MRNLSLDSPVTFIVDENGNVTFKAEMDDSDDFSSAPAYP